MTRQTSLIAGIVALLVTALWWTFLMTPPRDEVVELEQATAAAQQQTVALDAQIDQLEQVRAAAPEIESSIAELRRIVPDDPALPAALRQLQAAADDAGISLVNLSSSRPSVVDEASRLHEMALSIEASGSYFQVVDFLRRIEDPAITARGIVIDAMAITPDEHPTLTLTMTGRMFAVLDQVVIEDETDTSTATDDADAESGATAEAETGGDEPRSTEEDAA